jgi:hypothetical protein
MDLLEEFQIAVKAGDHDRAERIRKDILLESRDKSIDANFLASIKGKILYKNISRMINNQEFTNLECLKVISSLITHCIIESSQTGIELEEYPIHELYILLGNLINKTPDSIKNCYDFMIARYSEFMENSNHD